MRYSLFLLLLLFIPGCSIGPPYNPPPINIPEQWKNSPAQKCESFEANRDGSFVYVENWWEVFDDDKLKELENMAAQNNRDLFIAFERIQEARSLMGIAAGDFYPQITLNPQYTNTGELIKTYRNSAVTNDLPTNLKNDNVFRAHELFFFLPFNLRYEVDLWGKIRDRYNAEKYSWLSIKQDYDAIMLSLTANVAMAYYQLRAADAELDYLTKIIKTRQKAYQINLDRYENNISFYADVTLAAEEIENAKIQFEEIGRQRAIFENQIAVLLGLPSSEFCLEPMPLEGLPPCIPEGIPSEVLLRRPDIAEAEYIAKSQHAHVKEAYTLYFPSLILTGTAGFESPVFKYFLSWISRYWMEGLQINQIIFDGYKTSYNLDAEIARFLKASGAYQKQVLVAFQEVEDALKNIDSYAKQYDLSVLNTQWAEKTYTLYNDRYHSGVTYYINVANTERDLLNYQINKNRLQGLRFVATIQLIKALGGSW